MQLISEAAKAWAVAIEDRALLRQDLDARYSYLILLAMQAKREGESSEMINEMLEITDSALLWAREEVTTAQ